MFMFVDLSILILGWYNPDENFLPYTWLTSENLSKITQFEVFLKNYSLKLCFQSAAFLC